MSSTTFTTSHGLTEKLWGRKAFNDAVKETLFGKLVGKSDRSIIQVKDELEKAPGDRIRFRLRALPSGKGVEGDETLEGNEEGLTYSYFDLGIDEKRHAVKVDKGISEQRVNWDNRQEAKDALSEWFQEYFDSMLFEFMSGASLTYATSTTTFANNTVTAPTDIVYGGDATSKASIDANDKMDLAAIDRLVEKAKLKSPTMRKANFKGMGNYWVLILHPYQVHDLRTNTNTGQWLDIQKAAMMGGKVDKNPIFTAALGVYNGVILVENTRIQTFSDYGAGGNLPAARALFFGAQAGVVGFGREKATRPNMKQPQKLKWVERTFDYGKRLGVSGTVIWGINKTQFDGSDFAMIALDTYAAAHT